MTTLENRTLKTPEQTDAVIERFHTAVRTLHTMVCDAGTFMLELPSEPGAVLHVSGRNDGLRLLHQSGSVRQQLWLTSVENAPNGAIYMYADEQTFDPSVVQAAINGDVLTDERSLAFVALVGDYAQGRTMLDDFKLWNLPR